MGNTCYVNASIQAMRSVMNVVCPATEDDGPLLRALRRFVDARDEAGAAAFLDVVGEALGRDLRTPSDSAEFLQDLVSLLALENGAVERAFQSAWVPVSAALLCSTCGAESPAPEVTVGAEACTKEYVLTVPAVPEARNVTLAEALPLLEAQHTLTLTHAAGCEPVCPKCGSVSSNITPITSTTNVFLSCAHIELLQGQRPKKARACRGPCPQLCQPLYHNSEPSPPAEPARGDLRPCLHNRV